MFCNSLVAISNFRRALRWGSLGAGLVGACVCLFGGPRTIPSFHGVVWELAEQESNRGVGVKTKRSRSKSVLGDSKSRRAIDL